jgi:hypothetical protein
MHIIFIKGVLKLDIKTYSLGVWIIVGIGVLSYLFKSILFPMMYGLLIVYAYFGVIVVKDKK